MPRVREGVVVVTRMVLVKCANPKCWRYFPKAADSPRVCCDEACDQQRAAVQAQAERLSRGAA